MTSRRTRSSIQLREKKKLRSESLPTAQMTENEKREYERVKKQKQRLAKQGGEEPGRRGPKTKINLKDMTNDERKIYDRERKQQYRLKKKLMKTTDDIGKVQDNDIDLVEEVDNAEDNAYNADVEMNVVSNDLEGSSILRLIYSPSKKRTMPR